MNEQSPPILSILPSGHILNQRYRIHSHMGTGGFSLVYYAHEIDTQRLLIIKECALTDIQYRDPQAQLQLIREEDEPMRQLILNNAGKEASIIQTLSQQSIQGIPQYIDQFEENNTLYIVMTEAQGTDLYTLAEQYRAQGTPFPADILIAILNGLLSTLQQIHAANYYHCDIKPTNILIGSACEITLIDFGAARTANNQHDASVAISPGYSPPEFYPSHRGHIGPWTDNYMLAAMIYKIITGKVPEPADIRAVRDRNLKLTSIPALLHNYPSTLLASVDKAMNVKAAERFASADIWKKYYNKASATPQLKRSLHQTHETANWQTRKRTARKKGSGLPIESIIIVGIILAGLLYLLHLQG